MPEQREMMQSHSINWTNEHNNNNHKMKFKNSVWISKDMRKKNKTTEKKTSTNNLVRRQMTFWLELCQFVYKYRIIVIFRPKTYDRIYTIVEARATLQMWANDWAAELCWASVVTSLYV